jgi:hypothetical protein
MSQQEWMLVETFGGGPPSVIGVGGKPRNMVPLRTILGRGRYLDDVQRVVAAVAAGHDQRDIASHDGKRTIIAVPLKSFRGHIHGLQLLIADPNEIQPPREVAGAWYFNLTTDQIGGSDDLLDLYGVPDGERRAQRFTAEAFGRLVANADESAAFANIVKAPLGFEHQAVWTVRRDDDALRAAHFSCRAIAEPHPGSDPATHIVLRGITHDIGPAETTPSAPPPVVLAQQVLAGLANPGEHRAIVNMRNLKLLRWLDEPLPGVAWEYETAAGGHWIHPDDLDKTRQTFEALARGPQLTYLRFRTITGDWQPINLSAHLVILDAHTNAALLTLRRPTTN